jgi:hypothetical protein
MEKPYGGRAVFQETISGLDIIIPAKRNYFVMFFLMFWGAGWLMGEFTAIALMIRADNSFERWMMPIWLIPWSIAGFFVIRIVLWMLIGKEVLRFERGNLTVSKRNGLLIKPKTFDLREMRHIRVAETGDNFPGMAMQKGMWLGSVGNRGAIKFDYGLKTVRVGENIDEAEARFIINTLRVKGILTESN